MEDRGYSSIAGSIAATSCSQFTAFLEALRRQSLGDSCGEVAGSVFFFLGNGLVGGVAVGAAYWDGTDFVLFSTGVSDAATPSDLPHFLLLGPLGLVRIGLLGVCCEEAKLVLQLHTP